MIPRLQIAGLSPNRLHMLTASQLRAARALVGWSRDELAKRSGISAPAIRDFEMGRSDSKQGTVQKWQRALEAAGVQFIDADDASGPGVRLRHPKARR